MEENKNFENYENGNPSGQEQQTPAVRENHTQNYGNNPYASYGADAGAGYGGYGNGYQNQNRNQNQEQPYGAGTGSRYDAYGTNNAYGNNTYENNAYGNNPYQNATYQTVSPAPGTRTAKKRKERKPGGFGTKVAKCAALALVFGMVSGAVFEGIHYTTGRLVDDTAEPVAIGNDSNENGSVLSRSSDAGIEPTAVSTTYVATDVSDIVDAVLPSIVAITNVSQMEYQSFWGGMPQTYESTSCGTGIIVSRDDNYLYIATNNHVVSDATSLTVSFDDDSTVSAEVKGTDPSTDLAVIRVELSSIEAETLNDIKIATLGDSDILRVGEASIAIGNALGYGQSVTTGCISALNRTVSIEDSESGTHYTAELIQTDAAINPGNSGGALLNAAGEVIGINSVKYSSTEVEGVGYAIPINTASRIIEDLITKEKVSESESAYLGVAGVDVTDDVASTYNMPSGVYVAQVVEGSGAEQAGIRKGDIITKFDDRAIESMDELVAVLEYYKAGSTVNVTVMRSSDGIYQEQVISVTLGKKN